MRIYVDGDERIRSPGMGNPVRVFGNLNVEDRVLLDGNAALTVRRAVPSFFFVFFLLVATFLGLLLLFFCNSLHRFFGL